jgi:hypothetical protein
MDRFNGFEEMDLTAYLQTEGRRRASEMPCKRQSPRACPGPDTSARIATGQQQCAVPDESTPPRSLSEALRRMGIA